MAEVKNDFSKGSIPKHVLNIAGPMILAQLIHVLYNIVDRMFIGRISEGATLAMSGLGLCLPIISIMMAFANLCGGGGAPLTSIARGRGELDEAEEVMGNAFTLLIIFSILIMVVGLAFCEPLLMAFGASEDTLPYALDYLRIYLLGTPFTLIGLGMNSFINAQGFAKDGMIKVLIGAIVNIILDPIFIFVFDMGVAGAAIATVISQAVSAVWTLYFLLGNRTILKIRKSRMVLKFNHVKRICTLGLANFIMGFTNSVVSAVCNTTLQTYGGDMYIAIMTIINSIREIVMLPCNGIASASQPVIGFNYGAKQYHRVLETIKFITITSFGAGFMIWLLVTLFPQAFIQTFSNDTSLIADGVHSVRLYFFGFFMMAFQGTGQSISLGLGKSKQAIFFSIFRKVIIVAPLTLILPKFMGIDGVFVAEAISNYIGGGACYITMWFTIGKDMKRLAKENHQI